MGYEYCDPIFSTHKVVKLLQEKGYSEKEAEGFIEAIKEINLIGVATKQDISDLTKEIVKLESKMIKGKFVYPIIEF